MINRGENLQFRHFLTFKIWKEALRLLNHQISQKAHNRHYNTLDFFYYEKLDKDEMVSLEVEDYFNEKIANNFFYGLQKEFFYHHYTVPKKGIGLRKYVFTSYPMLVLYYSVGLYILRLVQQFIEDNKTESSVKYSFYGGNLKFTEGKINAKHDNTYYKYQYKKFKNEVKKQAKYKPKNKVIIKLDIQNYYETISVEKMLNLISKYVKPSEIKKHNFDVSTKELLTFFFNFANNGNCGILQGYSNIMSSFIGYFYLIFGDLFISDLIEEFNYEYKIIDSYKIIRYVDDTYLSISFVEGTPKDEKENLVYELLKSIADCFYLKLNLRFNSKLELFFLDNLLDVEKLKLSLKRTSPELTLNDEDNEDKPQKKFDEIIKAINRIKREELIFVFSTGKYEGYTDVLNETYDKSVEQIIQKPDNLHALEQAFENFNFDLFRIYPRVFTILISKTSTEKNRFVEHLLEKKPLTTFDVNLIINFLTQNKFENQKLIEKLGENQMVKPIINEYSRSHLLHENDFYEFKYQDTLELGRDINIMEQTRLRVYHEKLGEYSIALNHLLNEIHAICRLKDKRTINPKKYTADEVVKYLNILRVNSEVKCKIRNLFDRRNKNPISHPGSEGEIAWAVSKEEYCEYKNYVKECLRYILNDREKKVSPYKSKNTSNDDCHIKNNQISNILLALEKFLEKKESNNSVDTIEAKEDSIMTAEILTMN